MQELLHALPVGKRRTSIDRLQVEAAVTDRSDRPRAFSRLGPLPQTHRPLRRGTELAPLGRPRTAAASTSLVEDTRPRTTSALVEALATTRLDGPVDERNSRAAAVNFEVTAPVSATRKTLSETFAARRADLRELREATRALSDDTLSDTRSGFESRRSSISTGAIVVRDFSDETRERPPFGQAIGIGLGIGIGDDAPFS